MLVGKNLIPWIQSLFSKEFINHLILCAILTCGFALRIYRVGEDSLWYDEVGQVEAALKPLVTDMLNVVQSHAGAMPLDYFVTRIMVIFGLREEIIRFPSVLWGTLSIFIYYQLITQLDLPYKKQVALLSAFLIALSPIHIQYSQEARFYAALMFFYALAVFFLIKAVFSQGIKYWNAYLVSSIVGVYFHPYILFTNIAGFFIVVYHSIRSKAGWKENIVRYFMPYLVYSLLLMLAFLPGYFFFHTKDVYTYDFGLAPDSALYGLGLKATISSASVPPFGIWHLSIIVGSFTGMAFILKHLARYTLIFLLLVAVIIQIVFIMLLDYWNGYPFIPRQIIHFAPFVYLVFSIGFLEAMSTLKNHVVRNTVTAVLLAGLAFTALPYIKLIYDHSKGGTREISQTIVEHHQPGFEVVTIQAQHETVLRFYLSQLVGEEEASLMTKSFDNLKDIKSYIQNNAAVRFVYLPRNTDADVRKEIVDLGFKLFKTSEDTDFLFIRK